MRVVILPSELEAGTFIANIIVEFISHKENAVLGLATGNSIVLTYQALIEQYKDGKISFKKVTTFNLDEYIGLESNCEQSYRYYMDNKLFNHLDINKKNTHIPECFNNEFKATCNNYESMINDYGGIDIQLLGIGTNGHIGFNEPTSSLASRTRVKTLAENTIQNNSRFFDETKIQPKLAITMGIGTIMEAKQIILVGLGKHKSQAIADAIEGPITSFCPGSILQQHDNVIVVIDEHAASKLKLYDYYINTEKMHQQYMC